MHSARPLVLWPLISELIYRFDSFCGLLPLKSMLMCLSNPVGPQTSCVFVIGSWMASCFTSPVMSCSGTQGGPSTPTRARVQLGFLSCQVNNSFHPVFRWCFSVSFSILVFLRTCEMSPPKSFPKLSSQVLFCAHQVHRCVLALPI